MPAARTRSTTPRSTEAVDFDVQAQELQPDKPARIKLSTGDVIRMLNPIDLEWTVLADLANARSAGISVGYNAVLSMIHPEDHETFTAARITTRELDTISAFWSEHFDLEGRVGTAGGSGA